MNIGIFTDTYDPQLNGVVISIKTLKKNLEARGHKVYIITTTDHNYKSDSSGIFRLPSLPFLFSPQHRLGMLYSRKYYKLLKEHNLDIIHNQTEFSLGVFSMLVSRKLKVPVIHTYHTMWENYSHYLTGIKNDKITPKAIRIFSATFCNRFNSIIAPSEKTKQALISYGVKKDIDVVPTGIDFSVFRSSNYFESDIKEIREQFNISPDDKVILSLGRVAFEKSIDVIIKQLPNLLKKMSNFKFLIVGDGPAKASLEELVDNLALKDYVIFAGKQPWEKVGLFYNAADVFVSASTSETQGLTFLESMASGTSVIAKYDTNLDNVITDKYNGMFFREDYELTEILYNVLSDDNFRNTLVENAFVTSNEFSAEKFGEKMETIYEKVISNKKQSSQK